MNVAGNKRSPGRQGDGSNQGLEDFGTVTPRENIPGPAFRLVSARVAGLQRGDHTWQKQALERKTRTWESADMSIIWTIIIGFIAGIVAKFLHPGSSNEPSGFILTAALGIAGSLAATYLGQALGWYRAGEGAGFIGAVVGAIILLVVWGFLAPKLQKST